MDFKREAVRELREYRLKKQAVARLRERIAALQQNEDAETLQTLSTQLNTVERLTALTEQGLSLLTGQQRLVLEKFYIDRCPRHTEWLMEQLCVEQAQIYRLKDEALKRFTLATYGAAG